MVRYVNKKGRENAMKKQECEHEFVMKHDMMVCEKCGIEEGMAMRKPCEWISYRRGVRVKGNKIHMLVCFDRKHVAPCWLEKGLFFFERDGYEFGSDTMKRITGYQYFPLPQAELTAGEWIETATGEKCNVLRSVLHPAGNGDNIQFVLYERNGVEYVGEMDDFMERFTRQ